MKNLVYFENTYGDTDERGNKFVCIDGFPDDDNGEGRVVATVFLTPHNDIVVDWHDNGYRLDETVLTLVDQAISNLKASKDVKPCETIPTKEVLKQLADAGNFSITEPSNDYFFIEDAEGWGGGTGVSFDDKGNCTEIL